MEGEVTDKENDVKVDIMHSNIDTIHDNIGDNVDNSLSNGTQKSNSGENVYICPYCSAKFDQFIDYARGIGLKHPDKAKGKGHPKGGERGVPPTPGVLVGCVLACVFLDIACVLVCALCVSLAFLLACFGCLYLTCLVKSMDCVNSASQYGHVRFFPVLTLLSAPCSLTSVLSVMLITSLFSSFIDVTRDTRQCDV